MTRIEGRITGLTRALALSAAALTAAPAAGVSAGEMLWVEVCGGHDLGRIAIPVGPDRPEGDRDGLACHAACIVPRKRFLQS